MPFKYRLIEPCRCFWSEGGRCLLGEDNTQETCAHCRVEDPRAEQTEGREDELVGRILDLVMGVPKMPVELPYHCPRLRADYLQRPCEKNIARVKALLAASKRGWARGEQVHLGPLEHCRECRGVELVIRKPEEIMSGQGAGPVSQPENQAAAGEVKYCKNCPTVEAHKNKNEHSMGLCLACLRKRAAENSRNRGRKGAAAAPRRETKTNGEAERCLGPERLKDLLGAEHDEVPRCKNCPDKPAVIDRLGQNMGFCKDCLAARGRRMGMLAHQKGDTAAPCYIPMGAAEYADIKAWLEEDAKEFERTLQKSIMYHLKIAHRRAVSPAEAA